MPRGGSRPGSGVQPKPKALIQEAGLLLTGAGYLLLGLASNDGDFGTETFLSEVARGLRRDVARAARRLDRGAKLLRGRANKPLRTTTATTATGGRAEVSSDHEEVPLRHTST